MKFKPGKIVATPGALALQQENGIYLWNYLRKHTSGDWGDVCDEDKKENDFSVDNGFRILSAYDTPAGRLWVITESDRSSTTFLLPSEY